MVGQRKIGAHDQFMSLEVKIPSYLPLSATREMLRSRIILTGSSLRPEWPVEETGTWQELLFFI
jgi:hypothetical protein